MKKIRLNRILAGLLSVIMVLAMAPGMALAATGTKPADGTTTGEPFPQGTGGSNSFRIPALVTLSDGTLVAAADARWNSTLDNGGIDTIVSVSKDGGDNWSYTFANYLGDNDNTYNNTSTCFIDPALAVDNSDTVYMLCDLYPYGVAIASTAAHTAETTVGFNENGKLLLSADGSNYNYYLDEQNIYFSDGNKVSGYTVDEYFNITGTDGTSSNLFFSDSPFKVVRTGFLYLTKSTDKGATWSAPTLIPGVKTADEYSCLVGPGRGLVTKSGRIIFPVYKYAGSTEGQVMSFIYSDDNGASWSRSASCGVSWSSEAAVVELADGTLRFFYRSDNSCLSYVDYANGAWGGATKLSSIPTNSDTQLSAITYSKTIGGKQVILVSCPTGPNEAGSNNNDGSARLNGKIFAFTVESDNSLTKVGAVSVTSNESAFMYSCLTELSDGTVGILYEDHQNGWGGGSNSYYFTMDYEEYDLASELGVAFDTTTGSTSITDDVTGVTVTTDSAVLTGVSVTAGTASTVENTDGTKTVSKTWSISVNNGAYTGAATVKVPYDSAFDGCTSFSGYMDNGADANDAVTVRLEDGYFVCDVLHFSDLTITGSSSAAQTVTLKVGETFTVTDETGNYENAEGNVNPDNSVATMDVSGSSASVGGTYNKATAITSGKQYLITKDNYYVSAVTSTNGYNGSWSDASGLYMYPADSFTYGNNLEQYLWTITANGTDYTIHDSSGNYMIINGNNSVTLSDSSAALSVTYDSGAFRIGSGDYYLNNFGGANVFASSWSGATDTNAQWTLYEYTSATAASTEITFTGVAPGTTTAKVGNTTYNITVNKAKVSANVTVGGSITLSNAGTAIVSNSNSSVATATLSNGTLTVTGVSAGTTVITTNYGVYTITVNDGTPISIKENETTEIEVTLSDDQYVEWTTSDSSYVGVAGVYDSTITDSEGNVVGGYTDTAVIVGQNVTTSPVLVTGTVYNENGTVAGVYKWLVTVTEGDADSDTTSQSIYVNVTKLENCTMYYAINGGALIEVNGTGVLIDGTVTGDYAIMFFAAPDEGYALSYMYSKAGSNEYYTTTNGNPDGTGSDAWPFVDDYDWDSFVAGSFDGNNSSVFDTSCGLRWSIAQGNLTVAQLKVLLSNAISLGCDGVFVHTLNDGQGLNTDVAAVAQKLPEMKKEIDYVVRGSNAPNDANGNSTKGTKVTYYDGMSVYIGDTIYYAVTVYVPTADSTYGTITYSGITLKDETLKITALSGASSWTAVSSGVSTPTTSSETSFTYTNSDGEKVTYSGTTTAYTYTATLELGTDNFTTYVKGGKITNTASLAYTYKATYSSGNYAATSTAVAAVSVEPAFVVDFGLPIELDLSSMVEAYGPISTIKLVDNDADVYGSFSWDADKSVLTYTPTSVILDTVDLLVTLADDAGQYYLAIHPASNVLYEEGFMRVSDSGQYTDWATPGSKTNDNADAKQNPKNMACYGYDAEYDSETGVSGASYSVSDMEDGEGTEYLTVDFYGNCFDLIGTCGPDTGYVFISFMPKDANGSFKMVMVDTSHVGDTLYQVPLAHVDLALGSYTAYVFGSYRSAYTASTATASTYGLRSRSSSINMDVMSIMGRAFDDGLYADDVEFFYFDESSALAGYANSSVMTLVDNSTGETDSAASTGLEKPAGTMVEIDGFRVYGKSDNGAFATGEYDVVYTNVLVAANSGFVGYIEGGSSGNYGNDTYEAAGGPQNEIYLPAGENVVFNVNSNITHAQISARAVSGATSMQAVTNEDAVTISSNTEMYYEVELVSTTDDTKTITIQNNGSGLLALGNLKLTTENRVSGDSAASLMLLSEPTEETYATAFRMLRAYSGEEDTETPEEDSDGEQSTDTEDSGSGTGEDIVVTPPVPVGPPRPENGGPGFNWDIVLIPSIPVGPSEPENGSTGSKEDIVVIQPTPEASGGEDDQPADGPADGPQCPYLNKEKAYAYVTGFADGTVRPQAAITRAEVATIFYRMLKDEVRDLYWSDTNSFSDVVSGDWYNTAVSTLAALGIVNGNPDGTFNPNGKITRAEFATMAVRFFDITEEYDLDETVFSDIGTSWAAENILLAYELGLVGGNPDGTFRPDDSINRAEAMTIVNNMLGRKPVAAGLPDEADMITWIDNVDKSAWYYAGVQAATNSYTSVYSEELDGDLWTGVKTVPNWSELEKSWAAKHTED